MHSLIYFFHFPDMRMQRAVGHYQTIRTEIRIILHSDISHISSITPDVISFLVFYRKSLIYPIPYKTTLQLIVFINQIPVIAQIPHTISHGMGIFTKDKRHGTPLIDMLPQFPHPGIHRAINIGSSFPTGPFILYRTTSVSLFRPTISCLKMRSIPGFAPQRPDNDRSKIFISFYHSAHPLPIRSYPFRNSCQCSFFRYFHSVRFEIGFINQVKPVFVTKFVPFFYIGIMTASHSIYIKLLHQADIFFHSLISHTSPFFRIVFMSVYSFQEYGDTV